MSGNNSNKISDLLSEIKELKSEIYQLKCNNAGQDKFSYVFKTAKMVQLDWDFKQNKLVWSENAEETIGLEPGEFGNTKESFIQCIHPEDAPGFMNYLSEKFSKQSNQCRSEFRLYGRSGKVIWINGNGKISYDKNGEPTKLLALLLDISGHKKTEEDLKEQKEFLSLLLDHMPNQIFWKDKNLIYQGCNNKFADSIGLENPELIEGLNDYDFNRNHKHNEAYISQDRTVLKTGQALLNYTEPYHTPNNEERWLTTSKIPILKNNELFGILGIGTDITRQKQIEEEQNINNIRYESMFNNSPIPLWEEDFIELYEYLESIKKKGVSDFRAFLNENPKALLECSSKVKVTDVNRATLRLHKAKTKEELIGNLDKIFTPKSFEVFKEEVIAIAEGQKEFETEAEIKTLDGNPRKISLKLFIDRKRSNSARAILATIDITEKIAAENALKESETKFRSSFEASDVGMLIVSPDGKIKSANNAACKIFETNIETLTSNSFLNITHPDEIEKSQSLYKKAQTLKKPFTIEKKYLTAKGNLKWGLTTASPVLNDEGVAIYSIAHIQDITIRKNAEEEVIKSRNEYEALAEEYKAQNEELISAIEIAEKSDKLKSEFLQNLSHEIRTPMNAILGFSNFLDLDSISISKRKQYVNIIKNSGNQLLRIIDDILEISALETNHVQVINSKFNLNILLTELFTIFESQAKNQNLALYLNKGLRDHECTILSDESKLRKIMINLIENALKYTYEGYVEIGYQTIENSLILYVRDSGVGISESRQEHIFERFSQAQDELSKKSGGLGLGLSIVKENVKLLGGSIELSSKIKVGSNFTINIPNCICSTSSSTQNLEVNKKYEVLIAEDEEINFLYLESLMEQIAPSCRITHAKDGLEALEMCIDNNYDLVFMDIKMPKMNGYEATTEIKKRKPKLNIVAQTAYSTQEDQMKAKLAGCNDFMSKPISLKKIQKILNEFLI
ncbi:PAS domain-containing hybrid sensor histidine kinase/response regulator [Marinifilum sp. RC60d5]|uniref:PAS domain-containing hybrid sensor histidine kinase/response regulator n=1 Tax=Marinifilum sp. RC60d5 TaxID=3458414 RepID=UPI004036ABED